MFDEKSTSDRDRFDASPFSVRFSPTIRVISHPAKTLKEVSTEAHQVLCEHLGVADTVRFLNQFENGKGNYTQDRDASLEAMSVQEAATAIRQSKEAKNANITE